MSSEEFKLAESVAYNASTKEVVVTLKDGSRHVWPVRLLEMVKSEPSGWVSLTEITDQQLEDVIVYGGGKYILWDGLDQVFRVTDLLAGIYGREAWMQKLMLTTAAQ